MSRGSDWLGEARWGSSDTPLPPAAADTDPDPDDDVVTTPPEVVAMLHFDPMTDPEFLSLMHQWDAERAAGEGPSIPRQEL